MLSPVPHHLQLKMLKQLPSLRLFLFLFLLRVAEFPWSPTAACPPAEASRAFPGQTFSVVKYLPMNYMRSRILSLEPSTN